MLAGGSPSATELFYSYPPPVAQAMRLVAWLPDGVVLVLWGVGATLGLGHIGAEIARRHREGEPRSTLVGAKAMLVAPLFLPFAIAVLFGNLDAWYPLAYGALLLAAFPTSGRGTFLAAGIAVAVVAVAKLHPGTLVLWLLARVLVERGGRWRTVLLACVAAGLAIVGVSVLLGGVQLWLDYVAVVRAGAGAELVDPRNLGPVSLLGQATGIDGDALRVAQAVVTLVAAALTVLAALRVKDPVASLAVAFAASLVVLPVTWYHYPVALVPIGLALADHPARVASVGRRGDRGRGRRDRRGAAAVGGGGDHRGRRVPGAGAAGGVSWERRGMTTGPVQRPRLYPAALLAVLVFALVEGSGVSPWAGIRPMLIAAAAGLFVTVAATALLRDRDRGALLGLLVCVLFGAGGRPFVAPIMAVGIVLVLSERALAARRPIAIRWPLISRVLTTVTGVLLLAVLIRGAQSGRLWGMAAEAWAEAPGHLPSIGAPAAPDPDKPDVYLVLLDGYPRADVLSATFGIDNRPLLAALEQRDFTVASTSRSNYPATRMTLASMFNGAHLGDLFSAEPKTPDWRRAIDEGTQVAAFRAAGYEIVSITSGYEDAVLRRADRFIDTGQINEFERALVSLTLFQALVPDAVTELLVDAQHDRTRDSFDAAVHLVGGAGAQRFALVHLGSPHAPLSFDAAGQRVTLPRSHYPFDDLQEAEMLGDDYAPTLSGEIAYLDTRVIELVDAIRAAGRPSTIVVFSDHGSGTQFSEADPLGTNIDMRTANLLAVGGSVPTEVDPRATLVNLLPRILAHGGPTPPLAPEEIRVYAVDMSTYTLVPRPD